MIYVAYNEWGDLIAESADYDDLLDRVEALGYSLYDVTIASVTP